MGGDWGLVSASSTACITVWPAAYLRHAAEASGFALPSREEVQLELKRLDGRSASQRLPEDQELPVQASSQAAGESSGCIWGLGMISRLKTCLDRVCELSWS